MNRFFETAREYGLLSLVCTVGAFILIGSVVLGVM